MSRADPRQLVTTQYRDASKLNDRIALHQRFGTSSTPWFHWLFDQLALPPEARLLEVGCGPGKLWQENLERVPPAWRVTLSDLSNGMLDDAKRVVSGAQFSFTRADAHALAFADASFDAVLANHMLYHVHDLKSVLSEIRRLLKPKGVCYAATNGLKHMRELHALLTEHLGARYVQDVVGELAISTFTLNHGAAVLEPYFEQVHCERYANDLFVTEAEPLLAYIESIGLRPEQASHQAEFDKALRAIERDIRTVIARRGGVRITRDTGLFIARRSD